MMEPKSPITSRLPGRLRLRSQDLRRKRRNETLCQELRGWDGVVSVEGNPNTGGVLLCYDAGQVDPAVMEARILECLGEKSAAAVENEAGQILWRMNRYAKLGMMGSLTGTLLALAVGKKLHAALGAAHLAFLLVHVANHRKKLLK